LSEQADLVAETENDNAARLSLAATDIKLNSLLRIKPWKLYCSA